MPLANVFTEKALVILCVIWKVEDTDKNLTTCKKNKSINKWLKHCVATALEQQIVTSLTGITR